MNRKKQLDEENKIWNTQLITKLINLNEIIITKWVETIFCSNKLNFFKAVDTNTYKIH